MTTLLTLCKNKDSAAALELLNSSCYSESDIYQVDEAYFTPLIWACLNKMSEVALELLIKCKDKCKLDQVTDRGDTALIWACCNKMSDVVLELLKYPDKCKLDHVDNEGNTSLIYICFNKMSEVALELLKYSDKCKLDHVTHLGDTALIIACRNKMSEVALELLNKCPDTCKLNHTNNYGETALNLAYKYNLQDVITAINDNIDIIDTLDIDQTKKNEIYRYIKRQTTEHIKKLLSPEEIEQRYARVDMIENKIKNLAKNGECIMCYENTNNNIFVVKCKHVLHLCNDCSSTINNKCPVCMIPSEIISGCFCV
jgi:ankyrin repeat protein